MVDLPLLRPATGPAALGGPRERSEVRDAVARFLSTGLIVLLVVITPLAFWIRAQTEVHALHSATQITKRLADYAISPLTTEELLAGDADALLRLRARLEPWMRVGTIHHIKIWDESGRVVYSDDESLIRERFPLPLGREVFAVGWPGDATLVRASSIGDLASMESEVVRAFARITSPATEPLLLDVAYDNDLVRSEQSAVLANMAPPFLIALLVLQAAQLLPAVGLAKRVQRHQLGQRLLLQRAIEASDLERRRIARDLHDDVIQELSGLAYRLDAEAGRGGGSPLLGQTHAALQRNLRTLRAVTSELYTPDLAQLGLREALDRLVETIREQGVAVTLDVPDDLELDDEQTLLLFRVAREVLVNVAKHAEARNTRIDLRRQGDVAELTIQDDGRGFDVAAGSPEGHLGMRILHDVINQAGGQLQVHSRIGLGTTVFASLPLT
ncbi:sensor histidine kinase [Planctomonas deserti]|uniref:sensor histidine kinase n=1 Tax=Planctomonas deserti TaxID=2144185 RepID=UPI000D3C0F13|nr:ATP-binding protein [Planctomonas deserti]